MPAVKGWLCKGLKAFYWIAWRLLVVPDLSQNSLKGALDRQWF